MSDPVPKIKSTVGKLTPLGVDENINSGRRVANPILTPGQPTALVERLTANAALARVKSYARTKEGKQLREIKSRMNRGKKRIPVMNNLSEYFGRVRTVDPRGRNNGRFLDNKGRILSHIAAGGRRARERQRQTNTPVTSFRDEAKRRVRDFRARNNTIIQKDRLGKNTSRNRLSKDYVTRLNEIRGMIVRKPALNRKLIRNRQRNTNIERIELLNSIGMASNRMVGNAAAAKRERNLDGMVEGPVRHGKYFVTRNATTRRRVRAIDVDSEIAGYLAMPIYLDGTKIRAMGVAHMNQSVPVNFGGPQPSVRNKRNDDVSYLTEDLSDMMDQFISLYISGESHSKLKSRSLLFSVFAQSMKDYMAICQDAVVECRKALRPVRRKYSGYERGNLFSASESPLARGILATQSEAGISRLNSRATKLQKIGLKLPQEVSCTSPNHSKIFAYDGSVVCVSHDMLSPLQDVYKAAKERLRLTQAGKFAKVTRDTDKDVVAIRSLYGDLLIKRNILLYTYLDSLTDSLLHRNPNVRLNPLVREYMYEYKKKKNYRNAFRLRFEQYGGWDIRSSMTKEMGMGYKYSEPDLRDQYWRPSLRSFGKKGVNMYWIQFLREIYDWKRISNILSVASQTRKSFPNKFKNNVNPKSLDFKASLVNIENRLGPNLGVTEYGYTITNAQLVNPMNVTPWTPSYHRFGRSWYVGDYSEGERFQLPFGGYNEYSAPPDEQREQGLSGEALDLYLNQALTNVCQVEKGSEGRYTHIKTGGVGNMAPSMAFKTFQKLRLYSVGSKSFTAPLVWSEEDLMDEAQSQTISWMGPSLKWSILNAAGLVAGTRHPEWQERVVDSIVPEGMPSISTNRALALSRTIEQGSAQLYRSNIRNTNSSVEVNHYPSNLIDRQFKYVGPSLSKTTKGSKPKELYYLNLNTEAEASKRDQKLRMNRNFQRKARITAHNVGQTELGKLGFGLCTDPRSQCKGVRTNKNARNISHERDLKSLTESVFLIDSQIFCDVDDNQALYAHYAGNTNVTDAAYMGKSNRVPCRLPIDTTKRGGKTLMQAGKRGVNVLQADAQSGIAGIMSRIKENVLIPLFYGNQIISYYHFDDLMRRFLKTTEPLRNNSRTSAIQLNKLMDRPEMSDLMEALQYYLLIYIGESPSEAAKTVVRLTRFRKFNQNELAKYETTRMLRVLGNQGIMTKPVFTKAMAQLIVSKERESGLTLMQVDAEIERLKAQINEKPGFFESIKRGIMEAVGMRTPEFERKLTKENRNMGIGKQTAGGTLGAKLSKDTSGFSLTRKTGERKMGLTGASDRKFFKKPYLQGVLK